MLDAVYVFLKIKEEPEITKLIKQVSHAIL